MAGKAKESEKQLYIRSTLFILAANVLLLPVSFFLRPLIARFIGPEGYGMFALILVTAAIIPAFTLFSLNSAVLYFVSKHHKNRLLVSKIIGSSILFLVCLTLLLFAPLAILFPILVPQITFVPFVLGYAVAFIASLFYILQAAQQGLEHFKSFSITTFLSTFIAGVLSVAAAYLFRDAFLTVVFRALGMFLVTFCGFLLLRTAWSFSSASLKKIIRYTTPLALSGLVGSFYPVLDRYLIANFHKTAEVGFYDISYSLVVAILPFTTALFTVMSPRITKRVEAFPAYFKHITLFTTLLVTGFGLAAFYFSDILVTLLLGRQYLAATPIVKVLALGLPFMAFFGFAIASLNSLGKTKVSSLLSLVLLVCIVTFNVLLTKPMAGLGAAWANLASYLLVASVGVTYFLVAHRVQIKKVVVQILLFYLFVVLYIFVAEPRGFTGKVSFYVLFSLITLCMHKEFVQSVWKELNVARPVKK